jgi:hypothetical protein
MERLRNGINFVPFGGRRAGLSGSRLPLSGRALYGRRWVSVRVGPFRVILQPQAGPAVDTGFEGLSSEVLQSFALQRLAHLTT